MWGKVIGGREEGEVISVLSRHIWVTCFCIFKMEALWELPGGPVVRTRRFHFRGPGSVPGWGTKIPQAAQCGQKKKKVEALSMI